MGFFCGHYYHYSMNWNIQSGLKSIKKKLIGFKTYLNHFLKRYGVFYIDLKMRKRFSFLRIIVN